MTGRLQPLLAETLSYLQSLARDGTDEDREAEMHSKLWEQALMPDRAPYEDLVRDAKPIVEEQQDASPRLAEAIEKLDRAIAKLPSAPEAYVASPYDDPLVIEGNASLAKELFALGLDVLTSGNHVWKKREAYGYIDSEPRMLRPANYPDGAPGRGFGFYVVGRTQIAVANRASAALCAPKLSPPSSAAAIAWRMTGCEWP